MVSDVPHDSGLLPWVQVIWDFITDPDVTPFNRIKRNIPLTESDKQVRGACRKG